MKFMSNESPRIQNLLTEKELGELFGMNEKQLHRLRYDMELPFIRVTQRHRLYLESDIMNWLLQRRDNIPDFTDKDEQESNYDGN